MPVIVWAEYKWLKMKRCYRCSELIDERVISNRLNFAKVKEAVEKHLLYHLGKMKYR